MAVTAVMLAACGGVSDFRDGVPSSKQVALKLPESAGNGLSGVGTRRDGLEGETAAFYTVTRATTVVVNGGTALVLDMVARITSYPATTVGNDSATWGPYTEALSPNTWKLTVTRTAPDTYDYRLEGKGKAEADSAYRVVLSGTHHYAGDNIGNGTFLIDWDEAAQLPEHAALVGSATVTYARPTLTADLDIEVAFNQIFSADRGQRVDARYAYHSTNANGGNFQFDVFQDFVGGSAIEHGKLRSRWEQDGAGRSDVKLSEGDVTGEFTANECWDSSFLSRYLNYSWAPSQNYGTESACAFTVAEYSTL